MSISVTFLGTASGLPMHNRCGQTIVLTVQAPHKTHYYLLDVGDGASSLLAKHGFDHRLISAIFISHMHADHHCGLAQVLKTSMHWAKEDALTILTPSEGVEPLRAYLTASYLIPPLLRYPIQWIPLANDEEHALPDDVTIHTYANTHMAPFYWLSEQNPEAYSHYQYESYSAVLQVEEKRLIYAGNLQGACGCDELAKLFTIPCDLFIAEMAHVYPKELGRFLAGKNITRTVVTHFNPKWAKYTDEQILEQMHEGAGSIGTTGELLLAHDGQQVDVS